MDRLLVLALLCLLCMAGMGVMMFVGGGRGWMGCLMRGPAWPDGPSETPHETLDRRYASGEIAEDRYQAMRADLDAREIAPERVDAAGAGGGPTGQRARARAVARPSLDESGHRGLLIRLPDGPPWQR